MSAFRSAMAGYPSGTSSRLTVRSKTRPASQQAMMTAVEKLDKAGAARRAANERVEALLPALLNDAFASLS